MAHDNPKENNTPLIDQIKTNFISFGISNVENIYFVKRKKYILII